MTDLHVYIPIIMQMCMSTSPKGSALSKTMARDFFNPANLDSFQYPLEGYSVQYPFMPLLSRCLRGK
jgi:hypothetical protein